MINPKLCEYDDYYFNDEIESDVFYFTYPVTKEIPFDEDLNPQSMCISLEVFKDGSTYMQMSPTVFYDDYGEDVEWQDLVPDVNYNDSTIKALIGIAQSVLNNKTHGNYRMSCAAEKEKKMKHVFRSTYFYGNKISDYGLEHGYVDYATLAKSFQCIMNNDLIHNTAMIGSWEPVNGSELYYENDKGERLTESEYEDLPDEEQKDYDEYYDEIFQWFIIDERGADILSELTDEIVFYNEELDIYLWGVTHCGTSWDYVLTDIKLERCEDEDE